MAEPPQIPDELRQSIKRRRKKVAVVRVTFAISIALMVAAFFYANQSQSLSPSQRVVSVLPDKDEIWLIDQQFSVKNATGGRIGKFQLHRLKNDEITHGQTLTTSPDTALLLPDNKLGLITGSRLITIDLSKDDWPLGKVTRFSSQKNQAISRLAVLDDITYVIWAENYVEDKKGKSRLKFALLTDGKPQHSTTITLSDGHIDSMGVATNAGKIWVIYGGGDAGSMKLVEFTPEFTDDDNSPTGLKANLHTKAHVSDKVTAATYTTTTLTGKSVNAPFVVGLHKKDDDPYDWTISIFDGEDWHKADMPPRGPKIPRTRYFLDIGWHKGKLLAVYNDADKVLLAEGEIDSEYNITWSKPKTIELEEARDATALNILFIILAGLALVTFLQAIWLMLNRSRGLEQVLEEVIKQTDAKPSDGLEKKNPEKRQFYASPIARASALILDLVMTAPLVIMLRSVYEYTLVNAYSFMNIGATMASEDSLYIVMRATLVTVLILVVYSSICEIVWGKTFGKALLRLKVETTDGEVPAPWQIIVRNFVKIIELAHYILILIPMAFMFMSTKQQRLGDYLAKTVVVLDVVPEEQADDLDM